MQKSLLNILLVILFANSCFGQTIPHPILPDETGFGSPVYYARGVTLYKKQDELVYLQVIDIAQGARLEFITDNTVNPIGDYCGISVSGTLLTPQPGKYGGKDPKFDRRSIGNYWSSFSSLNQNAFSIMNGGFFDCGSSFTGCEMLSTSAFLSYPIKSNGKVISGGHDCQMNKVLKALSLNYVKGVADISEFYRPVSLFENIESSKYPDNVFVGISAKINLDHESTTADSRNYIGLMLDKHTIAILLGDYISPLHAIEILSKNCNIPLEYVIESDGGGSQKFIGKTSLTTNATLLEGNCDGLDVGCHMRLLPEVIGVLSGDNYKLELGGPITITPANLDQCATAHITIDIKNSGLANWQGDIYISLHKMNDDFIQDILVAPSMLISSGSNSTISVTKLISSIPQITTGTVYKLYVKYQTHDTPYPNEFPLVGRKLWLNPSFIPINYSTNCDQIDVPPGNYKSILLSGLNLKSPENELEFLFQGIDAQSGDIPVDVKSEIAKTKKMFKQALAIPEGNQWISLPVFCGSNFICFGGAEAGQNFQNTDIARSLFEADRNMKYDMFTTPISGIGLNTGIYHDWTTLVEQSPYISQLKSNSNTFYPFIKVRAGILSDNLNYVSQGTTKMIITNPTMKMHREIDYTMFGAEFSQLPPFLQTDLNNRKKTLDGMLYQRLTNGMNQTLPKINNSGRQYQQIREAYRVTAAAHWYKSLTDLSSKPFHTLINSSNLTGIMASPAYDQNYWSGQAFQYLNSCEQFIDYKNRGPVQACWWGGCCFTSYNLVDEGNFSAFQNQIDSSCFIDKKSVVRDSTIYFYGGTLDYSSAELTGYVHTKPTEPILGDTLQISVSIYNLGNHNAQHFVGRLYEEYTDFYGQVQTTFIGQINDINVDSFSRREVNYTWKPITYGSKKLKLTIDEEGKIAERKKGNNIIYDSFVIKNPTPTVRIVSPINGSAIVNKQILFVSSSFDLRDGQLKSDSLIWTSDIEGYLGTGRSIVIDSLSVGRHLITVKGVNANGYYASNSISIYFYPQGYPNVAIYTPFSNDTLPNNSLLFFWGDAFDLDEGSLCNTAKWRSNIDGELGGGCSINHSLSKGSHTISFSVKNGSDNQDSAIKHITIINGEPDISIISPSSNSSFYQHQFVNFKANALDFPQGNISDSVKWYSNILGFLGTGNSISKSLVPGNHIIYAIIQDNAGSFDSASVSITINNTPPVPHILQPLNSQTFNFRDTLVFIGHATDIQDGELHATSLRWFSNINGFLGFGDTLRINSLRYGYHTISLKAIDSDNADSTVRITNLYIDAGQPFVTIQLPINGANYFYGSSMKFKGFARDATGRIIPPANLSWASNIDGLFGVGDSTVSNSLTQGNQEISLSAIDQNGFIGYSTVNVFIEPPQPPSISISYPLFGCHFLHGTTILFRASAFDYEEGSLGNNRISWSSSIDGHLGFGKNIAINFLTPGNHIISTTARDTTGLTTTTTIQITIDQRKPIAQIISPISGIAFSQGTNIAFSGVANDYEDGTLNGSSLNWYSDREGFLGTGNSISHSSLSVGSHLIYLVASDSQNAKDTATIVVIIEAPHTIIQNTFQLNSDSVTATFGIRGGDTTFYFTIPQKAHVLNAQYSILADSVPFSSVEYLFAKRMGTYQVNQVLVSKNGSIYSGGYGTYGRFDTINLTGTGGAIFVAKQNSNGDVLWVKSFPTAAFPSCSVSGVVEDAFGNIYVSGTLRWYNTNFGCDSIVNLRDYDGFVAKMDSNGNCAWVKHIYSTGTSNSEDFAHNITIDRLGNIYVVGRTNQVGTINIGSISLSTFGGFTGYLAKLDPDGNALWAKRFKGIGYSAKVASDLSVYVCGCANGGYFDSQFFNNNGGWDAFLAKYDLNGNIQWVKGGGGNASDYGYDIAIDSVNNIYFTGMVSGHRVIWGGTTYIIYNPDTNNNIPGDYFISKYSSSGALLNFSFGGGSYHDGANSIAISKNGDIAIGGFVYSTTFQMDSLFISNPSISPIIVNIGSSGNNISGFKLRKGGSGNVWINSLKFDGANNLVIGGMSDKVGDVTLYRGGGFVAKRNHNPSQYPLNSFTDVFSDSIFEWQHPSYFFSLSNSTDFASSLNSFLNTYHSQLAQIPIKVHSDSAGMIKLKFLNIQYQITDTIKPTFVNATLVNNTIPLNSVFSIRTKVVDNEKIGDVKATFNDTTYILSKVNTDSFTINIIGNKAGTFPVVLTATDTNGLSKDTTLYLTIYSVAPDFEIQSNTINTSPSLIFINDSIHLTATVKNNSNSGISNLQVAIITNGITIQTKTINIPALSQTQADFNWLAKWGQDAISVVADPNNLMTEVNKNNNTGTINIKINDPYPPIIIQASAEPQTAILGTQVLFKVIAIDSTRINNVSVNWLGHTTQLNYNPTTNFYEGYCTAFTSVLSTAFIQVSDVNGLSSNTSVNVEVISSLPDLKIFRSDISFSPSYAADSNLIRINAKIHNSGNINVNNVPILLRIDSVIKGRQIISIMQDSFYTCSFNYVVNCGPHNFSVVIDSGNTINEVYKTNNAASVIHSFCPSPPPHSLTAIALPQIVSLGDSIRLTASISPNISTLIVKDLLDNQNMDYNTGIAGYTRTIVPSHSGKYSVPVRTFDVDSTLLTTIVDFVVLDSLPDISINKLSPSFYPIKADSYNTFRIEVSNNSLRNLSDISLLIQVDGITIDSIVISSLMALDTVDASFNLIPQDGNHVLVVTAILGHDIRETNDTNNSRMLSLNIPNSRSPEIIQVQISSPVYQGGRMQIKCYLKDVDVATEIVGNFMGHSYLFSNDTVNEFWETSINTPSNGSFIFNITAKNSFGLSTSAEIPIQVNSFAPDLEILPQNITYNYGDSGNGVATIVVANIGGQSVHNIKTLLLLDSLAIDSSIISIGIGQCDTIYFTFNPVYGAHLLMVAIDPNNAISEGNKSNNIASRRIFISDLISPSSPIITVNPSSWTSTNNFLISWAKVIDNSGKTTYDYSINSNSWTSIDTNTSISVSASTEGLNYIYVRTRDESGNVSNPSMAEMKFDSTMPNSPTVYEGHCGLMWTSHESPFLMWQNPGDIGSGVKYFEVSINNQSPINIGFKMNFHDTLKSGIHTMKVRAIDNANFTGRWSNMAVAYIDIDSPACPNVTSPTHPNQNSWYRNDSVFLRWERPGETSSVTGFFYMINHDSLFNADQNSYWTNSDSLSITNMPSMDTSRIRLPDGVWFVHISTQDAVGHISPVSCLYRLMIDKTPPLTACENTDTIHGCTYDLKLSPMDYYSGVAETYYRINGGTWQNDTIIHIKQSGINLVEFYSIDNAGNSEEYHSASIYLDNNNLSISLGNDTLTCDSIILLAPPNYSYLWSTGNITQVQKVIFSTSLFLQITDSIGCQATSNQINIKVFNTVMVNISDSICLGDSIYFNGSFIKQSGIYTKRFSTNTECDSLVSLHLYVDSCYLSPNQYNSRTTIRVFPNPTNKEVFIQVKSRNQIYDLCVVNELGQIIITQSVQVNGISNISVDLSKYPNGPYFFKIRTDDKSEMHKIILNR